MRKLHECCPNLARSNIALFLTILVVLFPSGAIGQGTSGSSETARRALPSVVTLRVFGSDGSERGLGSGFVMLDGRIATNSHVIEGAAWVEILTQSDAYLGTASYVEALSTRLDLAILPAPGASSGLGGGLFVSNSTPQVGEAVWVIGSPRGLSGTLSSGIVSSIREMNGSTYLQLTAPISPGSSGGPVLDSRGQVIGIAAGLLPDAQNLNFAVPASNLVALRDSPPGRFAFPAGESNARSSRTAVAPRSAPDRVPDEDASEAASMLAMLTVASDLQPGETRHGVLNGEDLQVDGDHFDLFKISGTRGDRVVLEMRSEEFDTQVGIFLADLEQEEAWSVEDDDGAGGTDSRLIAVLPEDGLYLIVATSYDGSFGRYHISLNPPQASPGLVRRSVDDRWQYVGSDTDDDEWWWDTESLRQEGALVTAWVRTTFAELKYSGGQAYDQVTYLEDFDCSGRRIRVQTYVSAYAGSTVETYNVPVYERQWRHLAPETVGEALMEAVCR